jgi:hypothetical protein
MPAKPLEFAVLTDFGQGSLETRRFIGAQWSRVPWLLSAQWCLWSATIPERTAVTIKFIFTRPPPILPHFEIRQLQS